MKIALTYSSKEGLMEEYERSYRHRQCTDAPVDFFAEGDSRETLTAIENALRFFGHEVKGYESDGNVGHALETKRPDLVFNIAEGLFGDFRESYVPLVCERLGLPYTGSDPLALAVCLNKARAKEILSFYGISNAPFRVIHPGQPVEIDGLSFPAIVKPVSEGSSKGIFNDSVVHDNVQASERISQKLEQYKQPVIVERFLEGDEFTVALWGNGSEVEVLPIIAIRYDDLPKNAIPMYSYEAKWIWDTPDNPLDIFQCPADISKNLRNRIESLCLQTYRVLGIRDWCRIDIRLDERNNPNVLEVNPLPGILPNPEENSCFPKAARCAGYNYAQILNRVVFLSAKRWGLPYETKQEAVEYTRCIQ